MAVSVRSYPVLTRHTKLQKDYSIYRLHEVLTAHNCTDRWVPASVVRDALMDLLDRSKRTVQEMLVKGEGRYWDYTRGTIDGKTGMVRVYTIEEVKAALGVRDAGPGMDRPLRDLVCCDYQAKAHMWLVELVESQLYSPPTRQTLRKFTGVAESTQRYYDRKLNTRRRANYVVEGAYSTLEEARTAFLSLGLTKGKCFIRTSTVYTEDGGKMRMVSILRQIGNSYSGRRKYSESSQLVYLGKSKGDGIWIDKNLCGKLAPDYKLPIPNGGSSSSGYGLLYVLSDPISTLDDSQSRWLETNPMTYAYNFEEAFGAVNASGKPLWPKRAILHGVSRQPAGTNVPGIVNVVLSAGCRLLTSTA